MANKLLLIIGNGFDLQCGLKSSYDDFFENSKKRKDYKDFLNSNIYVGIKEKQKYAVMSAVKSIDFTVWDLLFLTKSEKLHGNNWCDVEQEIKDSFDTKIWDEVLNTINSFQRTGAWHREDFPHWLFAYFLNERFYNNDNWQVQDIGYARSRLKIVKVSKDELMQNLFQELNVFEERFKDYLISQQSEQYFSSQRELMHTIRNEQKSAELSIISFNYTDIKCSAHNIQNVHGRLSDANIIFGISEKSNDLDLFTKSDRRRRNHLPILADILKNNIDRIAFYGSSFSLQDLYLFKSIFKKYGKDSNKVKYTFYYSNYGGIIREEEHNKIVKNLCQYLELDFQELREEGIIEIKSIEFSFVG